MQQTSIDAYHEIRHELGKRQQLVYDCIKNNGSSTNLEISKIMHLPINSVTPRTNELVKAGRVIQDCKRSCSVSGRTCISWKINK